MSRVQWILVLFLVFIILAITFLPWYIWIALVVVVVFSAKYVARWAVYRLFMMPFKAKGSVLRNAQITIHSIEPTAVPVPPQVERLEHKDLLNEGSEEDFPPPPPQSDRDYYRLEVTITPRAKAGGFQHWEPAELRLVLPDAKPISDSDNSCSIEKLEIEGNRGYILDEGNKSTGEQKLRMVIAVEPGVRHLAFQYYFEKFGAIALPGHGPG